MSRSWAETRSNFLCLSSGHELRLPAERLIKGLYVINTAEGKWLEREGAGVEEEKAGIMRHQPAAQLSLIILNNTRMKAHKNVCSCPDILWLLLWFLVKSASTCLLPSYTNPHQPWSEMSIFCQAVQVEQKKSWLSDCSLHQSCKNCIKIRDVTSIKTFFIGNTFNSF